MISSTSSLILIDFSGPQGDHPAATKKIVYQNRDAGQMQLRIAVKNFIENSDHRNVVQFRKNYEENAATINNESWNQYWTKMIQDKVWADYIFIQSTAWFLKHDIMIITTSNNDDNPVITISGNIDDETHHAHTPRLQ